MVTDVIPEFVKEYGFVVQMAAIVAAACTFIIRASNDIFAVEEVEVVDLKGDVTQEVTAKYRGVLPKKLRRRLPRFSRYLFYGLAAIGGLVIISLIAKKVSLICLNIVSDLGTAGEAVESTATMTIARNVQWFMDVITIAPDNLYLFVVILSLASVFLLLSVATGMTIVRRDYLYEKTQNQNND